MRARIAVAWMVTLWALLVVGGWCLSALYAMLAHRTQR